MGRRCINVVNYEEAAPREAIYHGSETKLQHATILCSSMLVEDTGKPIEYGTLQGRKERIRNTYHSSAQGGASQDVASSVWPSSWSFSRCRWR